MAFPYAAFRPAVPSAGRSPTTVERQFGVGGGGRECWSWLVVASPQVGRVMVGFVVIARQLGHRAGRRQ